MSIIERVGSLEASVDELGAVIGRQDERISGSGGVIAAMVTLTEEIKAMKRAMWTIGGGIVVSAVGFAFTVLSVFK